MLPGYRAVIGRPRGQGPGRPPPTARSAQARTSARSGPGNFSTNFPAQDVALDKADGLTVTTDAAHGWGAYFLSLNVNQAPFNNPKVGG
jgi:hypothetical protein